MRRGRPKRLARLARSSLALVLTVALASGCGSQTTPTPSPSVDAALGAALADLDLIVERLERLHPEPWHGISREDFVAKLEALKARFGKLDPDRAMVEVMRLVALLSRAGRDGHEFAIPAAGADGSVLPMRAYEFEEGLFITAALPPYEDLVGARVTAIGAHPVGEVLADLEPLIPRDGPATVHAFRPIFLLRTNVLRGLGLIGDGPVPLTIADVQGVEREVGITPVPIATYIGGFEPDAMLRLPSRPDTLYLSDYAKTAWTRYLLDSHTFYVRYTDVEALAGIDTAVGERAAQPDVDRVVIDLRQNPGGDNHRYVPLLHALQDYAAEHPGRLFVLTDRVTFSAAANLATEIEQTTDAIFVGEPMGGGLNFWGDATFVNLPDLPIPMRVGISTRYWQKSAPDDPRLTIEPDLGVPVRAADYFADRDPALEAATSR